MGESSDISLKVMRISRPMFQPEAPIHAEEEDLIYSTGSNNYSGLSNSLLIPNSVGDFYLGEPANFMVTVQVGGLHTGRQYHLLPYVIFNISEFVYLKR